MDKKKEKILKAFENEYLDYKITGEDSLEVYPFNIKDGIKKNGSDIYFQAKDKNMSKDTYRSMNCKNFLSVFFPDELKPVYYLLNKNFKHVKVYDIDVDSCKGITVLHLSEYDKDIFIQFGIVDHVFCLIQISSSKKITLGTSLIIDLIKILDVDENNKKNLCFILCNFIWMENVKELMKVVNSIKKKEISLDLTGYDQLALILGYSLDIDIIGNIYTGYHIKNNNGNYPYFLYKFEYIDLITDFSVKVFFILMKSNASKDAKIVSFDVDDFEGIYTFIKDTMKLI